MDYGGAVATDRMTETRRVKTPRLLEGTQLVLAFSVILGAAAFGIIFLAVTWLGDPESDFDNWFGDVLVLFIGAGAVALVLLLLTGLPEMHRDRQRFRGWERERLRARRLARRTTRTPRLPGA